MTSCFLEAEAFLPPVSGSSFQPVTYLLPALSHLMRQRKRSKTWISSLLQRVGFGFTVVSVWIWIGWSNAQVKNAPLLPLSGDESWENEQKQGVHCFPAKALALSVLDDFFPETSLRLFSQKTEEKQPHFCISIMERLFGRDTALQPTDDGAAALEGSLDLKHSHKKNRLSLTLNTEMFHQLGFSNVPQSLRYFFSPSEPPLFDWGGSSSIWSLKIFTLSILTVLLYFLI